MIRLKEIGYGVVARARFDIETKAEINVLKKQPKDNEISVYVKKGVLQVDLLMDNYADSALILSESMLDGLTEFYASLKKPFIMKVGDFIDEFGELPF